MEMPLSLKSTQPLPQQHPIVNWYHQHLLEPTSKALHIHNVMEILTLALCKTRCFNFPWNKSHVRLILGIFPILKRTWILPLLLRHRLHATAPETSSSPHVRGICEKANTKGTAGYLFP